MHQGLEKLQVIYGVLGSIIAFYLRHTKLRRKGEGIDGRGKWRIELVDQVIEVAGHSSSKGVHHKVHPFLHHLHLCDHMRWSHICDGWTAHVLSFWSISGVATFRPLLVPYLSAGTFLVFLLSVMPCVVLMQLLFQIIVLLGEAFHGNDESLNLSLECGYA